MLQKTAKSKIKILIDRKSKKVNWLRNDRTKNGNINEYL